MRITLVGLLGITPSHVYEDHISRVLGITPSHCYEDHISRVIRNNTVTLL
jgi:hypothetical protein